MDNTSAVNLSVPFTFIKFVSQSEVNDFANRSDNGGVNFDVANKVDGTEIREFYDELVAEPPSVQQCQKPLIKQSTSKKAVTRNKSLKTVKYIKDEKSSEVEKCCDNSHENRSKMIHRYAQEGNIAELKKCWEVGLNLDIRDSYGWTPLMCAVSAGHIGTIKFLIKSGVDLTIQTPQHLTALDIAKLQESSEEIQNLLMSPCNDYKIEQKASEASASVKKEKHLCYICKSEYEDSKDSHERSIAHLLFLNSLSKKEKTFYHIPVNNRGYQIMVKKGWDADSGLGPNCDGRKYPIKTTLKTDRCCIGKNKNKERITHFGPNDVSAIKINSAKTKLIIEREKTLKKRERIKVERKLREKEIAFRQSFNLDL